MANVWNSSETWAFLVLLLSVFTGLLYWGYRNFRTGWSEPFHDQVLPVDAQGIRVNAGGDGTTDDQRRAVLNRIFPTSHYVKEANKQQQLQHLVYEPESNTYIPSNKPPTAIACSICLEEFNQAQKISGVDSANTTGRANGSGAGAGTVVTAACNHSFHIQCLNEWCTAKRDELSSSCPNCRQSLWNVTQYQQWLQEEVNKENKGCNNRSSDGTSWAE